MIGCLRTCARKQPIIALYLKFETELKFYNLEPSPLDPSKAQMSLPQYNRVLWAKYDAWST